MSLIPADPVTSGRPRHVGQSALLVPILWALVAMALGTLLQVQHVRSIGSWEATLRVGAESPALSFIADDLGPGLAVTEGLGHDGYWFYLSAVDPFAREIDRVPVYLGYRHRRLLGPLLAGGGGLLGPQATLVGLSIVGILGFGVGAGVTAWLARAWGARPWAPLGAVLNVGLWLSVQLVTADTLAIGLGLAGVALVVRRRWRTAAALLALSVLAKETSLLFVLGAGALAWAGGGRRRALTVVAPPIAVLSAWLWYIEVRIGGALASNGNLGLPFEGMVTALSDLSTGADAFYAVLAVLGVVAAIGGVALARRVDLGVITVPWIAIAVLSTSVVWERGNNAVRVLAPCLLLGVLGLAIGLQGRQGRV